jgi:hypothetical protein
VTSLRPVARGKQQAKGALRPFSLQINVIDRELYSFFHAKLLFFTF